MAMPLAAMNPVMGISSRAGSYLVNVTNHDKDLTSDFTGVANSLDMDDNLYGLDDMGRFYSKHKYDIMKKDDIVEAWEIKTDNVQTLMEQIIKEASLPEERRPIHKESIYEFFTGKRLLDESQYDMDPLLEKVELKKMSAALNGNLSSTRQGFLQAKDRDEQSGAYTPDNDNLRYSTGVLLASQDMRLLKEIKDTKFDPYLPLSEGFLDTIKDKFRSLTSPPFNATPMMGILWKVGPKNGKAWPHFVHPTFHGALVDSITMYKENKDLGNKFEQGTIVYFDKKWFEAHKNDEYKVTMRPIGKPLQANTVYDKSYIPDIIIPALGSDIIMNIYSLEKLLKYSNTKYQLIDRKSVKEDSETDIPVESITPIEENSKLILDIFQNQADKLNLESANLKNLDSLYKLIKTPNDLLNYLNSEIEYGFFTNGKVEKENFDHYKTVSPEEFNTIKTGVCWDYAEFESFCFSQIFGFKHTVDRLTNNSYSMYYIQLDDGHDCPSHTWLSYMVNNKVYVIESSWYSNRGLHKFNSEKEMLIKYRDKWFESIKSSLEGITKPKVVIYKYKPFTKFGLNCTKYMNTIYDTGTCIYSTHPEIKTVTPLMESQTFIPYECETKYSHHWMDKGKAKPIKGKGVPMLIMHKNNKNWRMRSELLLFKDDKLFLAKEDKVNSYGLKYKLPGGGIDGINESIESSAARECEEEAKITPKNLKYTGIEIEYKYPNPPSWHLLILNPDGIYYDGAISFVCTAEYDKPYEGSIKKMDQDPAVSKGRFYSYDEVKDILSEKHKKLFKDYINSGYRQALAIYNQLSPKEQAFISPNHPGRFVDAPNAIAYYIHKTKDGKPIGFAALTKLNSNSNNVACLGSIGILKEFRRKGYAKFLIQKAKDAARKAGYKKIIYKADKDNIASIKSAESAGFKANTGFKSIDKNRSTVTLEYQL